MTIPIVTKTRRDFEDPGNDDLEGGRAGWRSLREGKEGRLRNLCSSGRREGARGGMRGWACKGGRGRRGWFGGVAFLPQ
ncbi:hypothetical protein E2C01_089771 [Portunus trituberculatus]|uniref:Uncharacterized protein n=1 Tax=Portunus trituberculatus TaxID=210409 RepID=A0A5B7JJ60_PORTR|nr:hypothetical protein [Portunus trituberculatus]